jgi:hypothetical protein
MVRSKVLAAALFAAALCDAATIGVAQAAQVEIMNRLAVACTLEATNLSIPVDAKSNKPATIADELGGELRAVCNGSGLDKDIAECKLLIGGTGGSGNVKDEVYDFKYVKEVHILAQIGRFLVCSSI